MLYLVWDKKIITNTTPQIVHWVLGMAMQCLVSFLFLPPSGIAFLISCPNPCRVPPLDMRLYPRTLAPSGRCSLLAALTWNCVLNTCEELHHSSCLVLSSYSQFTHCMFRRKGGSRHLLHSTLVASKSTVMALGQSILRFCTFLFPQDG